MSLRAENCNEVPNGTPRGQGAPINGSGYGGPQRVGLELGREIAQGVNAAGFRLLDPILDGRQHIMPIGTGARPDLLQGQALFVDDFQGMAVFEHLLDVQMMTLVQQAGFTRQ